MLEAWKYEHFSMLSIIWMIIHFISNAGFNNPCCRFNLISRTKPGSVIRFIWVILFLCSNKFGYPVCFNVVVLFSACVSWNIIQDTTCTENGDWQDIPLRWPQRHPYHPPHHAGQGKISFPTAMHFCDGWRGQLRFLSLYLFNRNVQSVYVKNCGSKFTISKELSHSKKLGLYDYKSNLKENYCWTRRWIQQVFWIICHTKLLLPWSIILSFNIGYHLLCILWKRC